MAYIRNFGSTACAGRYTTDARSQINAARDRLGRDVAYRPRDRAIGPFSTSFAYRAWPSQFKVW